MELYYFIFTAMVIFHTLKLKGVDRVSILHKGHAKFHFCRVNTKMMKTKPERNVKNNQLHVEGEYLLFKEIRSL